MLREGLGSWMAALTLIVSAGVIAGCTEAPKPYTIDLSGKHRFYVGDSPHFMEPDFDDSDWNELESPATWRVRTLSVRVVGWHRIHFDVSELPAAPQALRLGAIAWSDEVFLNGVPVGSTGQMYGIPRLGPRTRLYTLPSEALRQRHNVLAIRVAGIPLGVCGLLDRNVGIGDALQLERERADLLLKTQLAEGLLSGFLGLSWLLVAFFPRRGRTGRATLFLLATISFAVVMLWLLSATALKAGLSPRVGGNVLFSVVSLVGVAYGGFVAITASGGIPRLLRWLMAGQVVMAVLFATVPSALAALMVAGTANNMAAFAVLMRLLVRAARGRTPGAIAIALGSALGLLSVLGMFALPSPFFAGLPLIYYGIVTSVAFAVVALVRHIHHMSLEIQQRTEYSLVAHRRERNRLARDLHDGLGQMLALLKMQMQRMGRKHAGERVQAVFDESAGQVGATLDELRRMARDLRPAPMQDRSFGEAVREYAAAIGARTDLTVNVSGEFSGEPGESVADELYRIAQECLTNCLKHSGARKVDVLLAEVGDSYCLTIEDDGRGLAANVPPGLGLATIRERTELLGGACSITSEPEGGTLVEVSVPRAP